MQPLSPLTRDLVLIGGGHSHALVLRRWGMAPVPGVRLTLINPGPTAPYSGMLPGHLAGHYQQRDLEIDLVRLARHAGARLILSHAVGIDTDARSIQIEGRGDVGYDVASLDVGINAQMPGITGFSQHAVGAKPLDIYAARWRSFLREVAEGRSPAQVSVIGGGVAGVELALAMHHALKAAGHQPEVALIEAADDISGVGPAARKRLLHALATENIRLFTGRRVDHITPDKVHLEDKTEIPTALCVGAAGAFAHGWLYETGLPLTDGFVDVDATLEVCGVKGLFAVGDCANMTASPRPKAGVFAVRAGPVLYDNLKASLTGGALRPFRPQKHYLKLISLGGKKALAERHGFALANGALWRWKDRIDRKFMEKMNDLPVMAPPPPPKGAALGVAEALAQKPLCGGCGAKVGSGVLHSCLAGLAGPARDDVLTGPGDDAAILSIGGQRQVLTTDHLRAFSEDPEILARITAIHAMGDIWAMGARPQAALATLVLPRMSPDLQARTMSEIMAAAGDEFEKAGAAIVGGHSTMGAEMTVGFTVTGLCDGPPITQAGAQAGDALLLTRPIGSGVLLAAEMAGAADGRHVAALLRHMTRQQGDAGAILAQAHAMTDVTGFGLAGHIMAMCRASAVGAEINLEAVPLYDGALELSAAGHRSSLFDANHAAAPVEGAQGARADLLFDPQTAGGLLAAVPADQAETLCAALRKAGHPAVAIGQFTQGPAKMRLC